MSTASAYSGDRGLSRSSATLVTGAGGEVGHGLLAAMNEAGRPDIVAVDLRDLDGTLRALCREVVVGDICQAPLLQRLQSMFEITEIYHLAALLSTRVEFAPEAGHEVNVGGTLSLLRLAADQAHSHGKPVKFFFPSSIAAYGMDDLETKERAGAVTEDSHNRPTTMYGCNKLYCEHLGRYYAHHYRQLAGDQADHVVDFRALRYPGLISADTIPSGGTSDFAAEMIHAAAEGKPYACFVRPDTRIPFMTMPDAVEALTALASADEQSLSRGVYNVAAFNPSAAELAQLVREYFPDARITFQPDLKRQAIVDSWPVDVDDSAARRDWGYAPRHDLRAAFEEYLVPRIRDRYADGPPDN
ncbi:MAG: NAD-dependent epimerase/dehydratase family protein [Planctomycetota bacterium]|jgi:nucleoside-diphosphate-sugar epimerase